MNADVIPMPEPATGTVVIGFQIVSEMGQRYGADNEVLSWLALRNILNTQPNVLQQIKRDKWRIVPIVRDEIEYPQLTIS